MAGARGPPAFPPSPGAATWLLRIRYPSARARREETQLADRIAGLLSGCSTEQRRKSHRPPRRLLSLYFLTSKDGLERFRSEAPEDLSATAKILLSGRGPL